MVEYSEISAEQAAARDAHGRLKFNWSNICMHYFSVAWLHEVVERLEGEGARCGCRCAPVANRSHVCEQ